MTFRLLLLLVLYFTGSACLQTEDLEILNAATAVSIEIDFSDSNNTGGHVGYRYYFDGGDYPANYQSWTEWNCTNGPDYFGAWTDTLTVWIGTCLDIDLASITLTIDGQLFQPTTIETIPGAHQTTYELNLPQEAVDLIYIIDNQPGVTSILLNFNQL